MKDCTQEAGVKGTRTERTLAIIKPDGVARRLTGEIINRFEVEGLRVVAAGASE